jgi:hypothetical protein
MSAAKPSSQAKWNSAHPLARWAHNALRSALKRGLLKQEPCEVCGAENADGHHPDYQRPLYVVWWWRHHQAEHKAQRGEGGR